MIFEYNSPIMPRAHAPKMLRDRAAVAGTPVVASAILEDCARRIELGAQHADAEAFHVYVELGGDGRISSYLRSVAAPPWPRILIDWLNGEGPDVLDFLGQETPERLRDLLRLASIGAAEAGDDALVYDDALMSTAEKSA